MTPSAIACAVGGGLILAEALLLRMVRRERTVWPELVFNLNSGHILMWAFRGVEIAVYAAVFAHLNLHWVDRLPRMAQWIFALFAWDLCFYWRHRTHHRFGLLWAVHIVHHQGEHFNLSLCNRNSWYASLTDLPFIGVLAVLGLPLDIYVAVSSFHYAVQFFNHSGLVRSPGVLDRFLVTPRYHRVHHRAEPQFFNRNFGGTFLLWDKFFRTFTPPDDGHVHARYGVDGIENSRNPLRATHEPLLRLVGVRWPDVERCPSARASAAFVTTGALLLYGLLICWLNTQHGAHPDPRWMLMGCTLAGTIALGAHCDGKRWALPTWCSLAFAVPVVLHGDRTVSDAVPAAVLVLFAIHGVFGIIQFARSVASPSRLPQR
ncbi:sterol desaturase family protein [Paraburkholderia sp. Tr-20389]|uniref:sterol desaturase family protein n=1 Tax=Paraburkholderia sp. Tr-20389 TaxID=2703903 RepID=UPI0019818C03|nr:sterol desaturase family protein [Paraburkholderia sp. Tr-20389]MBN3751629.1 sterol desaturase family protein [Paraburkholderia sp. Tr-20389]